MRVLVGFWFVAFGFAAVGWLLWHDWGAPMGLLAYLGVLLIMPDEFWDRLP